MAKTLPKRSEVPEEHTWDIKSVYPSDAEWEKADTAGQRRPAAWQVQRFRAN